MNNEQFRRLLADNSSSSKSNETVPSQGRNAPGGATPSSGLLGSRMRSSIPMTPYVPQLISSVTCSLSQFTMLNRRSVSGVDFVRQLAEQRREGDARPSKRFKSSAAPKGTKLPVGYQDRAQLRSSQEESADDIQNRIKALEEMVKLGQIDQATFEKLRTELGVGGDTESTHMVKGLDWELLKRVKAGEDVSQTAQKANPVPVEEAPVREEDAEEEFERLMEERGKEELVAAPKEQKEKKKGTMAPPPPRKKTRDEILKELRANRAAAPKAPAPAPESTLGSRFKKLGDGKPEKKRFVEVDEATGRRREVLVITDAEGNTKRKVRWIDKSGEVVGSSAALPMPDKAVKPLGMEVPADIAARPATSAVPDDDEDDDIFAGVGADYDPFAGMEEGDSASDEDDERTNKATKKLEQASVKADQMEPEGEAVPSQPRNYFTTGTTSAAPEESEDRSNPLAKDPTILAALKRAAALRQTSPSAEDGDEPETSLRYKKFLEEARRRDAMDAADMDLGFGSSRIEDDEDEEGVPLEFERERGGKKRRRGPKKKKGDKDSVGDVMRVLDGRKKDAE